MDVSIKVNGKTILNKVKAFKDLLIHPFMMAHI